MKIGYFDCFSGASGDMILGALIDAGCPLEQLQQIVARLNLPSVSLSAARIQKQGIGATKLNVEVGPEARKKHRHLPQIEKIIDDAALPVSVVARAKAVFRRLAEAEAQVHGTTPEKVHFHEVGAADAIVDIVCACAAVDILGLDAVRYSNVPVGSGTVLCEHGVMPVPAPATANLLIGISLAECDEPGELITPTGAALLTVLGTQAHGRIPTRVDAIGYGAGSRDGKTRPNLLRVLIGHDAQSHNAESDLVSILEANIDDDTGQSLAHACQMLREAGALDVWLVPIMMKKGRPGQLLGVICQPSDVAAMETILFRETTTLGVRRHEATRTKLAREQVRVETAFGPISVKIGRRGEQVIQAWPEYEDCAEAAKRAGVALRTVQAAALSAWREQAKTA